MKAAVLEHYNKKGERLKIEEKEMPSIGPKDVLVKIKAAAVNPLDNMIIRKEVELIVPYKTPLVLGNEFAGEVEQVGSEVHRFQKGDRVYGRMPLDHIGAFAQYASVPEDAIAKIPFSLTYEQAATVPLTALTAMQAFDLMHVQKGKTIFISGGSGSLGAMAIPIAKKMGLHVITSGNAENKKRVLSLGADEYDDYKKEDYAKHVHDVDYVLDTLGDRELPKEFAILKEGGSLVSLRGLPNGRFAKRMHMPWYKRALFSLAGRKYDQMAKKKHQTYDFLFVKEDGKQLERLEHLFDQKHPLETSIDTIYPFEQVNEALEKVRTGRSKGKTLLKIDPQ